MYVPCAKTLEDLHSTTQCAYASYDTINCDYFPISIDRSYKWTSTGFSVKQKQNYYILFRRTSLLKWLVAGLSLWKPGVNPRTVHVKFVVNKVALEGFSLSNLFFAPSLLFY